MLITKPEKIKGVPPTQMNQEQFDELSIKLLEGLKKYGGLGISANQLGINQRAVLVNVKEPLVLLNPRVTEVSKDSVAYVEQCLSVPKTLKKPVKTVRFKSVTIECDNLGTVIFSPDSESGNWNDSNEFFNDMGLLECVIAQQVVDLIEGRLITDPMRRYTTTLTKGKTYGRNEMVMVKLPNGETEFMKYKKAQLIQGVEIL